MQQPYTIDPLVSSSSQQGADESEASAPIAMSPAPFDRRTFRAYYREKTLSVTRTGLGFAVAIIAAICTLDYHGMEEAHTNQVFVLRLGLMLFPIIIAFLISFVDAWRDRLNEIVTIAAFICGIGTFADSLVAAVMQQPVVLWGNIFFTFVIYLILGLPFRHSVVAASPILLISLGFGIAFDTPVHKLAYVFFSQVIGMYTSYRLEQDARELYRNMTRLEEVSRTDSLTGIFNRRVFDEFFPRTWLQARRDRRGIGIVLVDIDYFKDYNDHYGHQLGDDCIEKIAQSLAVSVRRPLDFVARYGGEEFVVVLYDPDETYLERFAEELRSQVEAMRIPHEVSAVSDHVTVSAGAGIYYPADQTSTDAAIGCVDRMLYLAKQRGRNRVVVDAVDATTTPTAAA